MSNAVPTPELSTKSRTTAGLLSILLGFGIGRFYTGHTGKAFAMLFTCGGLYIWSLIDGIKLLTDENQTDGNGKKLR